MFTQTEFLDFLSYKQEVLTINIEAHLDMECIRPKNNLRLGWPSFNLNSNQASASFQSLTANKISRDMVTEVG